MALSFVTCYLMVQVVARSLLKRVMCLEIAKRQPQNLLPAKSTTVNSYELLDL